MLATALGDNSPNLLVVHCNLRSQRREHPTLSRGLPRPQTQSPRTASHDDTPCKQQLLAFEISRESKEKQNTGLPLLIAISNQALLLSRHSAPRRIAALGSRRDSALQPEPPLVSTTLFRYCEAIQAPGTRCLSWLRCPTTA